MSAEAAKKFFFLGLECLDEENFSEAENHLSKSLELMPSRKSTLVNLSIACLKQDKLAEAYKYASEAKIVDETDHNTLNQLSVVLIEMKRCHEALDVLENILRVDPYYLDAVVNKGKALYELGRFNEAIESFNAALSIDSRIVEAIVGLGNSLRRMKKLNEAMSVFDKAVSRELNNPTLLNASGVLLQDLGRFDDALKQFEQALKFKPKYPEAFNNLGNLFFISDRKKEAVISYDKAIEIKSNYAEAYYNKGLTLQNLKDFTGAISCYEKASTINPDLEFLKGSLIHAKMHACAWGRFDEDISSLLNDVTDGKSVAHPFGLLALTESPAEHLKCVQTYAKQQGFRIGSKSHLARGARIKIGYVSTDFGNHATTILIREVIEKHDRGRFCVHGFSLHTGDQSSTRENLIRDFDYFWDCHSLNDIQVMELIRREKIDLLIDLNGYTAHCRPQIFAGRPATVQINYLGYPGTMGVPFMDYIIADPILIPLGGQEFFSEKIIYMPHSYQPNDARREISQEYSSRSAHKLRSDRFVFCCFNAAYKILPSIFDCWMRILKSVDGSVLWLIDDNPVATKNLKREAEARGVSPERIVFAPKMPLPEHLARHRCADLFLDTLPYNAHTTASDALWAGLPVLTRRGEAFAGRVAASLLSAVDLPELITYSEAEYEMSAIRLAKNPDELGSLKKRLAENRLSSKLFDTPLYVRHLEAAFEGVYERYHAGLPPDHIYVKE